MRKCSRTKKIEIFVRAYRYTVYSHSCHYRIRSAGTVPRPSPTYSVFSTKTPFRHGSNRIKQLSHTYRFSLFTTKVSCFSVVIAWKKNDGLVYWKIGFLHLTHDIGYRIFFWFYRLSTLIQERIISLLFLSVRFVCPFSFLSSFPTCMPFRLIDVMPVELHLSLSLHPTEWNVNTYWSTKRLVFIRVVNTSRVVVYSVRMLSLSSNFHHTQCIHLWTPKQKTWINFINSAHEVTPLWMHVCDIFWIIYRYDYSMMFTCSKGQEYSLN